MARETQLSPKRRRLAAALRALRGDDVSGRELARRLGWSQSKVSKIEQGVTKPTPDGVRAWALALRAPHGRVDELVELARDVQVEAQTWRDIYATSGGIDKRQRLYAERDAATAAMVIYQPSVVPGILQTGEYARHVMAAVDPDQDPAAVARAVTGRLERQTMLYDETRTVETLITEQALRWTPGSPTVLLAQLDRIVALMSLPSLTVGVIPLGAAGPPPSTPIVFRRFVDDEDPLVTIESLAGEENVTDPDAVARCEQVLGEYRKVAVFDEAARAHLQRIMREVAG